MIILPRGSKHSYNMSIEDQGKMIILPSDSKHFMDL